MPWRLPADLKRFKAVTLGHPVVMGRRTFESLKKPLPGRDNIVLSRDPGYAPAGCVVARAIDEALAGRDDVMVIGGAHVYELALPAADRILLTIVWGRFDGDAFFPALPEGEWREVAREEVAADEQNAWATTVFELRRSGGVPFVWPRELRR